MTGLAPSIALFAAFLAVATGCHRRMPPQPSTSAEWWASTNSPVVALWDGGNPMRRKPPFIIFAAWGDGLVVRSLDGRLQQGQVSREDMRKLTNEVEASGFFSPILPYGLGGLTRPDGPVRRLAVMRNGKLVHWDYDGYKDFRDVGPYASPSRQQMEAFVQMWERVIHGIDSVPAGRLRDFHGERELRLPDR